MSFEAMKKNSKNSDALIEKLSAMDDSRRIRTRMIVSGDRKLMMREPVLRPFASFQKHRVRTPHLYFTIPTDFRDREVGISKTPVPLSGRKILSRR